ncbi:hypothetical protein AB0D04_41315 [Streptomyces sp. NPDC048483]|uniref:hypothetical protein n=1 Tax=Streptomyces sp. NPDC048483 TaxID=3154927 RepID=UPI00342AC826
MRRAADCPTLLVESAHAFEEMKAYIQDRYEGVYALESSVDTDGRVVDHIPADAHPAARRWGGLATAPDEDPPHVPEPYGQKRSDPRSEQIVHPEAGRPVTAQVLPADTTPL